ncbi:MAG: hypothetical protein B5M54_09425 [Candidatus Aminicenantes bacterium 4484_214]|nr:MAG: hypothetical protein B5M54_09425 [Candidatus Aminicenantes bacterium 4484_214]
MKKERRLTRWRAIFFLVAFTLGLSSLSRAKISVFLSLEYAKGQAETLFSLGTFYRPILGLSVANEINPKLDYFGQFYVVGEREIHLDEAWLRLRFSSRFTARIGLYIVPFGYYNEHSLPFQSWLIQAPLSQEYLYPYRWRDLGGVIEGVWGDYGYCLYIGNGLAEQAWLAEGQQFSDNNKNKALGGRITWNLGKGLEIGYSRHQSRYDEQSQRSMRLGCYHLAWVGESASLIGEYIRASLENPSGLAEGEASGVFVQGSLRIFGLRPVLSYQKVDYSDPFHGPGFTSSLSSGEGIDLEKKRWSLGLVYPLFQTVFLKFEYDWNIVENGSKKDDVYFLQATFIF